MDVCSFKKLSLDEKVKILYLEGEYVMSVRYYGYKVNLYLLHGYYLEAFYNHRRARLEKIDFLDHSHNRMKWYADQIRLPNKNKRKI